MKIKVKDIRGLELPKQGTPMSAGYDVVATSGPRIVGEFDGGYRKIDYIEYGTNLFIAPENSFSIGAAIYGSDYFVECRPRSSISKYNLLLCNSPTTIDTDYRGEILVRFKYIFQPEDLIIQENKFKVHINESKIYKIGDKICQLRPVIQHTVEWELVEDLDATERNAGGFGSTGN